MCFPVKVSAFAFVCMCVCVWKIRSEMKRKQSIFYGDALTHGKRARDGKWVKEADKSYAQTLEREFLFHLLHAHVSRLRFYFVKVIVVFLSQCEMKSMCIVLQMMTRKGSKHTKMCGEYEQAGERDRKRERGKDCLATKIGMLEMSWVFFCFKRTTNKKHQKVHRLMKNKTKSNPCNKLHWHIHKNSNNPIVCHFGFLSSFCLFLAVFLTLATLGPCVGSLAHFPHALAFSLTHIHVHKHSVDSPERIQLRTVGARVCIFSQTVSQHIDCLFVCSFACCRIFLLLHFVDNQRSN